MDLMEEVRCEMCWPSAAVTGHRFDGQAMMLAKPARDYVIGGSNTITTA